MKKIVSFLLSVLMCLSVSSLVFADDVISEDMQNAILLAKEKLGIDDNAFVMEDCFETTNRGQKTYSISWKSRDEYDSKTMSVEIDSEGLVWGYHTYNPTGDDDMKPFPGITWDEGRAAANAFLEKMNPSILNESAMEEIIYSKYSGCFTVSYNRMHNGIKVGNSASVSIDAESGQATSLTSNWDRGANFEEGEYISIEDAREIFKNEIGYDLYYFEKTPSFYADDTSENEICLVYMLKGQNKYINAFTGQTETYGELSAGGSGGSSSRDEAENSIVSDSNGKPSLSDEEIAYLQQMESLISKEEAESNARAIAEFHITDDFALTEISLTQSYRDKYIYQLFFNNGADGEDYRYARVTVDAKNGAVTAFDAGPWTYTELTDSEIAEKIEQDKANAQNFINQYYPDLAGEVVNKQNTEYGIEFARVYDGVEFSNNGFSFSYRDGKLSSFALSWSDLSIPSKDNAKSLDEAYGVILAEDKFTLSYVPTYSETQCDMRLAYHLEDTSNYSAETLLPLNYRMEEKEEIAISYTDIAGHYAENAIQKFAEVELVLGDPKATEFRPEETVRQEEFLTLACQVFNMGTQDIYKTLVSAGILTQDEIQPDKEVTRMEGIRYIVKLFGLGETAEKADIFKEIYTDVAAADRGYAAIAAGYGIVNSEVSELYPNNGLRRADAVLMLYNWFTN